MWRPLKETDVMWRSLKMDVTTMTWRDVLFSRKTLTFILMLVWNPHSSTLTLLLTPFTYERDVMNAIKDKSITNCQRNAVGGEVQNEKSRNSGNHDSVCVCFGTFNQSFYSDSHPVQYKFVIWYWYYSTQNYTPTRHPTDWYCAKLPPDRVIS